MSWPALGEGLRLFVLRADEVDIADLALFAQWLDPRERVRLAQFRFEPHRREYLAGRGLTRQVLAHYTGQAPQDLRFEEGRQGKPALHDPCGLHFNLSHACGLNVLALSRLGSLGVDVECIEARRDIAPLVQRFFAAAEGQAVARAPMAQRQRLAFSLWTLKEALSKALGLGLSMPLDAFAFELDGHEIHLRWPQPHAGAALPWQLGQHALGKDVLCAWALNAARAPSTVSLHEVTPGAGCRELAAGLLRRGSAAGRMASSQALQR